MSKKVLFVLTSHDELGNTGKKTGFWSEELAAPYYALADKELKLFWLLLKEVSRQLTLKVKKLRSKPKLLKDGQ